MKIGSVQFFKRLIVGVYVLLLVVPLVLAILFGVLYTQQQDRMTALEVENEVLRAQMQGLTALPEPELMRAENEAEAPQAALPAPSFAYQEMYPDLYASAPVAQTAEPNVCYLTFDDGPSGMTQKMLDTLGEYGIKATFFVTGEASEEYPERLREAVAAGHAIGVHSYSHDYDAIYASVEAFLDDFYQMYSAVKQITGVAPTIFRFPGGSINTYNTAVFAQIIAEMTRRGFVFYDWNAAGSDAVSTSLSAQEIVQNVLHSAGDQERLIVLLHDRGPNSAITAAALPQIIAQLQARGFRFAALTSDVLPVHYAYP